MCGDDFFGDNFEDSSNDPSNDIEDDLFDDGEWYEDSDNLVDEPNKTFSAASDEKIFDQADAFILGSMIVGNAYEDAMERKRSQDAVRSQKKNK